jgi:ankyrin repeat protein
MRIIIRIVFIFFVIVAFIQCNRQKSSVNIEQVRQELIKQYEYNEHNDPENNNGVIITYGNEENKTQEIVEEAITNWRKIIRKNSDEENLLIGAIISSNADKVKEIISNGINLSFFYDDPNTPYYEDHYTPLFYATRYGSRNPDGFEILKMLLDAGCDPNIGVYDVVAISSYSFWTWYVDGGITPLMMSINPSVSQLLIDYGADLNYQDQYGRTALMLFSYFSTDGNNDCLELFLKNGAGVNITDNTGKTALHYATWGGNITVIELLKKYGADINKRDDNGLSPLVIAHIVRYVWGDHPVEFIELLTSYGAELKKGDEEIIEEGKKLNIGGRPDDLHIGYGDR